MNDTLTAPLVLRPSPEPRLAAATRSSFADAEVEALADQRRHAYSVMEQRELQAIGARPEQREQIRAILAKAHDDVRLKRRASLHLHKQLAQVLTAPSMDSWDAESVRQEILAHQEGINLRLLHARLEIAALLTPVQREKLLALEVPYRTQWQGWHTEALGA